MGIVAAAKALWDAFALRACSVTTAWLLSLIFALMAVVLIIRPQGFFGRAGLMS